MGGFIISLAYGIPVKAREDPHLNFSEESVRLLAEVSTPGSNFVDVLPFLKYVPAWFPGAGFQRKARDLYYMSDKFRSSPFNAAVTNFVSWTLSCSSLSNLIFVRARPWPDLPSSPSHSEQSTKTAWTQKIRSKLLKTLQRCFMALERIQ